MNGSGVSKLSIVLSVIFVISLAVLLSELFYVLWRRRLVHRKNPPPGEGGNHFSPYSSSVPCSSSALFSKDFLYFFCVSSQSRVQPNLVSPATSTDNLSQDPPPEVEIIDVWKLERMCGPPRFLFTIKEEEKEDLESLAEKSLCSSAEKESKKSKSRTAGNRERMTLKECFEVVEETSKTAEVLNDTGGVGGDTADGTDSSTPGGSPVYFTPSGSPIYEEGSGDIP